MNEGGTGQTGKKPIILNHTGQRLRKPPRGRVHNAFVIGNKHPLAERLASPLEKRTPAHNDALDAYADEVIAHRKTAERLEQTMALLRDREMLLEQQAVLPARLSLIMAGIHHELRTPLTAVIGFTSVLDPMLDEGKPEKRALLGRIEHGGIRMHEVLNMARDYLLAESGRLEIKKERLDLRDEAARIVELMRPRAGERKLTLELRSSSPVYAEVDPAILEHVLASLIKGSIKCTGSKESISVSLERQRQLAVITVSDAGHPLASEELAFALDRTDGGGNVNAIEGRGLGFVVAKAFAEAMGGRISVESTATGTTFTLAFQLAQNEKEN